MLLVQEMAKMPSRRVSKKEKDGNRLLKVLNIE